MKYVGVDGCPAGWFAVILNEPDDWRITVYPNISDLWKDNTDAALVLMDIPIGLLNGGTEERACDIEARQLLGERKRSVFPAPCRDALDAPSHKTASEINWDRTGRGLSRQAWNICSKIKQVNDFLRSNPAALLVLKETHPELCFAKLNGDKPMEHSKKKLPGYEERLKLLRTICKSSDSIAEKAIHEHYRKDVAKDDILDALVLAVTALKSKGDLYSVREDKLDSQGLPMKIHYYSPEKMNR
jgi:predicted RNase H-like nuclease